MKPAKYLSAVYLGIALSMLSPTLPSCSKYTVTTTENNPADVYFKKKVMTSYFWGKVSKPQRLVDSCGDAGIDEVKISSNIGYSLIHIITLGCIHKVKVEWKCHKPCSVIGFQP
ncbi:MAG: hypothetical protein ACJ75B_13690 [Flavisolibacter sp.]